MRPILRQLLLCLAALTPCAAESMWRAETLSDGTLYSDQVARKKGDLITIVVKETVSVTDSQKTETKRKNDLSASVDMVPGSAEIKASEGTSTVGRLPAVKAASDKNFKGEGKYESTGEVKAMITGRVVDVLDNGNLVVEGRRQVRVNADLKTILVTGVVRSADIKSDNTVMSEKLHNFQVAIEGEGPLARSQQQGILGQIADVLWPF